MVAARMIIAYEAERLSDMVARSCGAMDEAEFLRRQAARDRRMRRDIIIFGLLAIAGPCVVIGGLVLLYS